MDHEWAVIRAREHDFLIIGAFIREIFDHAVRPYYEMEGIEAFYEFIAPDQLRKRNTEESEIYRLMVNNKLGGVFELEKNHLRLFFIDRQFRGQGYARKIIMWVRHYLIEQDKQQRITLFSAPGAVSIYEHLGFRKLGEAVDKGGISAVPMVLTF